MEERRAFLTRAGFWGTAAVATTAATTMSEATTVVAEAQSQNGMPSIRSFGVLPGNTASENAKNLQAAIDWASERGAALFVEPTSEDVSRYTRQPGN